jgi:hypothetical protein
MARESNLNQVESERMGAESHATLERGEDTVTAAPNPGVIVFPSEEAAKFRLGLSGSLTHLVDGTSYLVAGSNINIVSSSNGSIVISANVGGIQAGGSETHVQFNDGDAELGGDPAFTFNKVTKSLKVTNLSGSLTKLSTGDDFLIAGPGIQLSTGSNGSITISSSESSWTSYTPVITGTTENPVLPTEKNLFGKYSVQGKLLTVIFNLSGDSVEGASAGSGNYVISLPPDYQIDTDVISLGSIVDSYVTGTPVGSATILTNSPGSGGGWSVVPVSQNSVVLIGQNPGSATSPLTWGSSNFSMGSTSEYRISFVATIPIM